MLHDSVDETSRGSWMPEPVQRADGSAKTIQLEAALRAGRQVRLDLHAWMGLERLVEQVGEPFAGVVTGHERKRSILSFRSMRARCRRDFTVPSSSPSARAISS